MDGDQSPAGSQTTAEEQVVSLEICHVFQKTGRCSRGDRCRYLHVIRSAAMEDGFVMAHQTRSRMVDEKFLRFLRRRGVQVVGKHVISPSDPEINVFVFERGGEDTVVGA